jgi:hypothetical protein
MKTQTVERPGEKAVLLPPPIGDALAANDLIKLRLSLLQEAAADAQAPQPRAARGEDVVAGRDIPGDAALLAARLPEAAEELSEGAATDV